MQVVAQGAKLIDVAVTLGPDGDCARHITDASESTKQHGHAIYVGGAVAALHETLPHQFHVRRWALQLKPGLLVAARNGDFTKVLLVVALGVAASVVGQTEGGTLFSLGPEPLTANIRTYSREDIGAENP